VQAGYRLAQRLDVGEVPHINGEDLRPTAPQPSLQAMLGQCAAASSQPVETNTALIMQRISRS